MKLLSAQLGIFSEDSISRPDLLFSEVNEKLGGIVDDMPTILNLPPDLPADIPVVQAKSSDGRININVSRSRIDLIVHFIFESNAFPGWIVLSTAGAAVLVGGIVAGSVISNRKSKDDKR